MDSTSSAKIQMTSSREDWMAVRDCFVNSFRHYPLYKYMVPDQLKRDAFLRAYLDANYDVTVGSGDGILLGVKVAEGSEEKMVGGVLFVPPSSDGCGWAIGSDEPYWKAYDKYGLGKISPEGLRRVKRYEAWENEHICTKLGQSRSPMWNGLFCSIDPQYASKGVGTAVYKEAIRIMAQDWAKRQRAATARPKVHKDKTLVRYNSLDQIVNQNVENDATSVRKFIRSLSLKNLHCNALLHHRVTPNYYDTKSKQKSFSKADCDNSSAPLVVAISHSDRAARFHASNGFHPLLRIPYCDVNGEVVFYTHVLALDPFCTGKVPECKNTLCGKATPISPPEITFSESMKPLELC